MSPPALVKMEDTNPEVLASKNSNSESRDSDPIQARFNDLCKIRLRCPHRPPLLARHSLRQMNISVMGCRMLKASPLNLKFCVLLCWRMHVLVVELFASSSPRELKKVDHSSHTTTILLVGIPNVGKSALANSLHRIGRISAAVEFATVSPQPGETVEACYCESTAW